MSREASGGRVIAGSRDRVFSQRLRVALDCRGWSQNDLASSSEVSVGHVSMVLRGLRNPSLAIAAQFARALGVSLDWLVGLKE